MNALSSCHLRSRLWRDKSIDGRRILLTLIYFLWLGVLALQSANYYVATNGIDGTGLDWGHAASNIQYAVDLAIGADDTVWVSNGSYRVTNQISITNRITVKSANGWTNTIVYADWPTWTTRCFYVTQTGVVDGFMITNGHYMVSNNYNGGGGALVTTGTVQNCYFRNNICSNSGDYAGGGAVYLLGNGTISNCMFVTNIFYFGCATTWKGGGGAIVVNSAGNIIGCHIASNRIVGASAGRGGAIYGPSGVTALISNCTFDANFSGEVGKALYIEAGATVTDCIITNHKEGGSSVVFTYCKLRNCLIANNINNNAALLMRWGGSASNCIIAGNESTSSGALGGGVVIDDDNACVLERCVLSNNLCSGGIGGGAVGMTNGGFLRNCLIHNNTNKSANGRGGGVLLANAALNRTKSGIINCTIVNNYSTNEGGGICTLGTNNYVVDCIIANNSSSSGNYPNVFFRDNPNANMSNFYYSCVITSGTYLAENQGNITNDPLFMDTAAGNWRLNVNSPCVNKGTNISWMTNAYDFDGRTRIRYGTVDMGAYERINEGTIYQLQ